MLQKAPNDGAHANVFGFIIHIRSQATRATHDQLDANARFRRLAQRGHHDFVGQRVDFRHDQRGLARFGKFDFRANGREDVVLHGVRCPPQMFELRWLRQARQMMKNRGDIFTDFLVGGEQSEVGVEACSRRVVVAGAYVRISTNRVARFCSVALAAQH